MRILFLADNFPPEKNAQASRVFERACYWVKWGHEVTVITCTPNFPEGVVHPGYRNEWHRVEEMSGIRVVRVKTFISANAGIVRRILDFLSYMVSAGVAGLFERRPSVVVATSPQFFAAVAGRFLSWARRVPFVFELSDLWPESIIAVGAMRPSVGLRLIEKLELSLYRHAAAVVTLTHAFRENLTRRGIDPASIAVVMNGVDLPRYWPRPKDLQLAAEWGIGKDEFVLGYIGTHGMAHGLRNILRCADKTRNEPIRYLFVGAGAERSRLVAEARELNLANVTFVPAQSKQTMPEFWSLCDVALIHLRNNPVFETVVPSKIFEAMGMGLPLLMASPPGEGMQIVLQENAGLWVPADDADALVAAARRLRTESRLRETMAENSHAAAPKYSRERQARAMIDVLDKVVGHGGEKAPLVAEARNES